MHGSNSSNVEEFQNRIIIEHKRLKPTYDYALYQYLKMAILLPENVISDIPLSLSLGRNFVLLTSML